MEKTTKNRLKRIYGILYKHFGEQHWWPATTDFEVIVGAILTQSTSWRNVEKAISNLRDAGVLSPTGLKNIDDKRLSELIRPSLYHNTKARKLKAFTEFLYSEYGGDLDFMRSSGVGELRPRLLGVWGVGPETADSILLYALGKPCFVVDAYTRRVFSRLDVIDKGMSDYSGNIMR
jgi:endonuclease-3 related protein